MVVNGHGSEESRADKVNDLAGVGKKGSITDLMLGEHGERSSEKETFIMSELTYLKSPNVHR